MQWCVIKSDIAKNIIALITGNPGIIGKLKNKLSGIGAAEETANDLRRLEIKVASETAKDSAPRAAKEL